MIGNLQLAPSDELTSQASFCHSRYLDDSQQYSLVAPLGPTNSVANGGSFALLDNPPTTIPIVRTGTYANVALTAQSLYVRPFRDVWQQSWGGTWQRDRWTVGVQGDFTQSKNDNDILIFAAAGTAPGLTYTGATSPGSFFRHRLRP